MRRQSRGRKRPAHGGPRRRVQAAAGGAAQRAEPRQPPEVQRTDQAHAGIASPALAGRMDDTQGSACRTREAGPAPSGRDAQVHDRARAGLPFAPGPELGGPPGPGRTGGIEGVDERRAGALRGTAVHDEDRRGRAGAIAAAASPTAMGERPCVNRTADAGPSRARAARNHPMEPGRQGERGNRSAHQRVALATPGPLRRALARSPAHHPGRPGQRHGRPSVAGGRRRTPAARIRRRGAGPRAAAARSGCIGGMEQLSLETVVYRPRRCHPGHPRKAWRSRAAGTRGLRATPRRRGTGPGDGRGQRPICAHGTACPAPTSGRPERPPSHG